MEPDAAQILDGDWTGRLAVGPGLRLVLRAPNGLNGPVSLISLDQGASAIPGTGEETATGRVLLEFPAIRGRFEGKKDGAAIVGQWMQGANALPLTFQRGAGGLAPPPVTPLTQEGLVAIRTKSGAPAIAAAAQRQGRAALLMADGMRAADASQAVTTNDKWHIGSITKSVTATLVAALVDDGAIGWDDTVQSVLGATAPDMLEVYKSVTLRHLLSHRSGMPANIAVSDLLAFRSRTEPLPQQRQDYVRRCLAAPAAGPKEATAVYSNSGFVVAGAMLEAKTGMPWEDLVRTRIFGPLGMQGAGFGAPDITPGLSQPVGHAAGFVEGMRIPYRPGDAVADNPAVLGPAGTIHARMADMLSYLAAHRDRGPLLKAQSWSILHAPPFGGNSAMGWIVDSAGLWHNGSNTLWYAEVAVRKSGAVAFAGVNYGALQTATPAVGEALKAVEAAIFA